MLSNIELKKYFVQIMSKEKFFSFEEDNPFLIEYNRSKFFVFIKNISSAHFKNSPDISRIQLPFSEHYKKIANRKIPFIILGYDHANDVFVNWDPSEIENRLNAKKNVSLYSRISLQANAGRSKINLGTLNSGSKFLLFKSNLLPLFFNQFHEYYRPGAHVVKDRLNTSKLDDGKNYIEVTDKKLLAKIIPLLKANRVLDATSICYKFYEGKLKDMKMADWLKVVNDLHSKVVN